MRKDITDRWRLLVIFVYNPVGGDITDRWGGHHGPLGGTSRTKTPLEAAEMLVFFAPKLLKTYFKLLKTGFSCGWNFQNRRIFIRFLILNSLRSSVDVF